MRLAICLILSLGGLCAAVDFRTQIQPILAAKCVMCHGANQAAGGVRLDTRGAVLKPPLVTARKPESSSLFTVLELPPGQPKAMPPGGPQLSKTERDLVRQWILEGAVWPEGTLVGTPAKPVHDEKQTVQQLHRRINAQSKPDAVMKPYRMTIPNSDVSFEMVPIPGGEFTMGTPATERGRGKDEGPQRKVKLAPFWMSKHEVTWDEYRLFMFSQLAKEDVNKDEVIDAVSRPTRPYVEMSFGMGINGFPAISMTQHAANKYAEWLSAKTGQFYRLPTEAEWEYACRAGTSTAYSFGDDPANLGDYAWYSANSNGKYQKVGTKKPNPGDFTTCTGTSWSGPWTNMIPPATPVCQPKTPGESRRSRTRTQSAVVPGTTMHCKHAAAREWDPTHPGSSRIRNFPRASGITPTRNGSVFGWSVRSRFPPRNRCIATGIAVSKKILRTACLLLAIPLLALDPYQATEPHMGTLVTITLYADSADQAQQAFTAAFGRIHQLDNVFSDYKPDSELSCACALPGEASPDLLKVVMHAQGLAEESGGAFDITSGPVVRLWRQARRNNQVPTRSQIEDALSRTGYRKLRIAERRIECAVPGMQLDAGGIAKGYAADEALAAMRNLGVTRCLVAVSGDIAAGDPPPNKPGWTIRAAGQNLVLANRGVSTSGDEFQFVEINGTRYSHIIDPRSGTAIRDSRPVTVIAGTGMEADAVATACSVLGADKARNLARERAIRLLQQ
jgi:thiamine biosynthesis lipoprotein ApbE